MRVFLMASQALAILSILVVGHSNSSVQKTALTDVKEPETKYAEIEYPEDLMLAFPRQRDGQSMFYRLMLFTGFRAKEARRPQLFADRVQVLKSERLMRLLRGGRTIRSYRIALGANPDGPKLMEGDKRTPEGEYFLDWRNPESDYYKSIHISYPNERDREAAERAGINPGGLIMIHGLPEDMGWVGKRHVLKDWTDGCIAVTNAEMDEIWAMVRDGTPIEIR